MNTISSLQSYLVATAVCIGATIMSWISGAPSSCFHLAVVICSLYGRQRVGIFSVGLSILSFDYFFLAPHFQFSVEHSAYPRLVAFIATAVCINLVIAAKQRGEEVRREVEEQLQKLEERLARASQIAALGEVSASIAHEINQPLTAIIANAHMCSEALRGDCVDVASARDLVQEVLDCGYHASNVVQRVRTLFRGGGFVKIPLDLNEVAKEVLNLIRSEATKRRICVEIDLEPELPEVLGDRVQIQQVLVNLCINGFDAMDSLIDGTPVLSIRTRVHDQAAIRVEVQDNGVGLRDQEKIFEAFYTTKENGMGLGLPICRSIIELHDGRLWPQSADGSGTTFFFTMPVANRSLTYDNCRSDTLTAHGLASMISCTSRSK
jgi:signal transduction histidine kinase